MNSRKVIIASAVAGLALVGGLSLAAPSWDAVRPAFAAVGDGPGRHFGRHGHGHGGSHKLMRLCSERRDERLADMVGFVESFVDFTPEQEALRKHIPGAGTVYQEGEGCDLCQGRGVRGMRAFFEVLPVDVRVREALYAEARGERGVDNLLESRRPSIVSRLAEAVAAGEVSLSELWDVL